MDVISESGPQAEIEHLEERIEALAATIENCRKVMLAARAAIAFGGILIAGLVTGLLGSESFLVAAIVSLLGGIVLLGSNSRTATEAREQLEEAEIKRDEWIGALQLRDLGPRTFH